MKFEMYQFSIVLLMFNKIDIGVLIKSFDIDLAKLHVLESFIEF